MLQADTPHSNQLTILEEIEQLVGMCPALPNAAWQHRTLMANLVTAGWNVRKEVASEFSDGVYERKGRIDLYAMRNDFRIAIEIDRRSPRTKSVLKLRAVDADLRIIVVREQGFTGKTPAGIDRVLCAGIQRGKGAVSFGLGSNDTILGAKHGQAIRLR